VFGRKRCFPCVIQRPGICQPCAQQFLAIHTKVCREANVFPAAIAAIQTDDLPDTADAGISTWPEARLLGPRLFAGLAPWRPQAVFCENRLEETPGGLAPQTPQDISRSMKIRDRPALCHRETLPKPRAAIRATPQHRSGAARYARFQLWWALKRQRRHSSERRYWRPCPGHIPIGSGLRQAAARGLDQQDSDSRYSPVGQPIAQLFDRAVGPSDQRPWSIPQQQNPCTQRHLLAVLRPRRRRRTATSTTHFPSLPCAGPPSHTPPGVYPLRRKRLSAG